MWEEGSCCHRTKALQRQLAGKGFCLCCRVLTHFIYLADCLWQRQLFVFGQMAWSETPPDDLTAEEKRLLVGLCIWLAQGGQGEFQELRWDEQGKAIWRQVSCQRYGCGGNLCPWLDKCYFFAARKNLNKADLIVVNHALLLSDIAIGGHILPPYEHLIIDEAHNLDRTAFEKLATSFTVEDGLRMLAKLSERGMESKRGYLASLKARYLECIKNWYKPFIWWT